MTDLVVKLYTLSFGRRTIGVELGTIPKGSRNHGGQFRYNGAGGVYRRMGRG